MTNINKILKLMKKNNNTITTKEIVTYGINRYFLTQMVRRKLIERIARGIYIDKNELGDEFFNIIIQSKKAVFSHSTALYLHRFTDRTPYYFILLYPKVIMVYYKNRKVRLFYIKRELFNVGLIEIESPQGKRIRTYDVERTICDLLRSKKRLDGDMIKDAIKSYLKNSNKIFIN